MTSAQVVELSMSLPSNNPSWDYFHLDDQTTLINIQYFVLLWDGGFVESCVTSKQISGTQVIT